MTDMIGHAKFSSLSRLIHIVLSISHGQADVERGFSLNKATLRTDRNGMNQDTLVALRIVKDNVSQYDKVIDVPITKGLIKAHRAAHQNYQTYLKKKRESQTAVTESINKRKIETETEKLEQERNKCVADQKKAEMMISEANNRIAAAVKANKFDDVRAAHAILEAGNKLLSECRKFYKEVTDKLNAGQHQAKAKRSA